MERRRQVVFVTGCSTGIGRATAEVAHLRGHLVVATARRPGALDGLPDGILKLQLDVCSPEQVGTALDCTRAKVGPVTALVNNAGYGEPGPIELLDDQRVRRQFDTNVFGALRLIRGVLPEMRAAGYGTIVNVSSAAAHAGIPTIGVYSATKLALEGISAALRAEVVPFGIRVVVVSPGAIRTKFAENAYLHADDSWLANDNPYWPQLQRVARLNRAVEKRYGKDASLVAAVIMRALEARSPRSLYSVSAAGKVAVGVMRTAPNSVRTRLAARLLR